MRIILERLPLQRVLIRRNHITPGTRRDRDLGAFIEILMVIERGQLRLHK